MPSTASAGWRRSAASRQKVASTGVPLASTSSAENTLVPDAVLRSGPLDVTLARTVQVAEYGLRVWIGCAALRTDASADADGGAGPGVAAKPGRVAAAGVRATAAAAASAEDAPPATVRSATTALRPDASELIV